MVTRSLRPCPDRPNCVSTESTQKSSRMEPIAFTGSVSDAQDRLRQIVRGLPRSTITIDEPGYLGVEFQSRIFRFVDDAEFLFDESSRTIRFRSGARLGYSDLGVNRTRMEEVARAFARAAEQR